MQHHAKRGRARRRRLYEWLDSVVSIFLKGIWDIISFLNSAECYQCTWKLFTISLESHIVCVHAV